MLRRQVAILIAALSFAPIAVRGQTTDHWNHRITFKAKNEPLADVIFHLFVREKLCYRFTPEARKVVKGGSNLVTIDVTDVPLRVTIQMLVRLADSRSNRKLSPSFDKKTCVFEAVRAERRPMGLGAPADRSPGRTLVTLTATDVPALQVLKDLLNKVKTGHRIQPELREMLSTRRVTVQYDHIPLETAFHLLLDEMHAKERSLTNFFDQDRGYYVFYAVPKAPPAPDLTTLTLTIDAKDKPIADVLKWLFSASKVGFAYSPEDISNSKVTASATDATLPKAVQTFLQAAGLDERLRLHESEGVCAIGPPFPVHIANPMDRTVTAHFNQVDVKYAIKGLMNVFGADYTLDPLVMGVITADFDNVPFRTALEAILKTCPLQTVYRVEGGIYNITPAVGLDYERWK